MERETIMARLEELARMEQTHEVLAEEEALVAELEELDA